MTKKSTKKTISRLGYWSDKLSALKAPHVADAYFEVNIQSVQSAVVGRGPEDPPNTPCESGACMVVNISSAHIPSFCVASRNKDARPYKNAYDLGKYRIGDNIPNEAKALREVVDEALPVPRGVTGRDIYFGAMDLNGSGIYFYGDICLVLKSVPDNTTVLATNSYDLVRLPLKADIEKGKQSTWPQKRKKMALSLSGKWGTDRSLIAAHKVMSIIGQRSRRITTGQISDAILVDEDYIEILKKDSFGSDDLSEARLNPAEAAREALISDRVMSSRRPPRMEELMWRERRRVAERELRDLGVQTRVVTTSGRVKG